MKVLLSISLFASVESRIYCNTENCDYYNGNLGFGNKFEKTYSSNLYLPPEEFGSNLCSISSEINDGMYMDLESRRLGTNSIEGSVDIPRVSPTRKIRGPTMDSTNTSSRHRTRRRTRGGDDKFVIEGNCNKNVMDIALLLEFGTCTVEEQALIAISLNESIDSKIMTSHGTNEIGPRIKFLIFYKEHYPGNETQLFTEDVELWMSSINYKDVLKLKEDMIAASTEGGRPFLTESAYLPIDAVERKNGVANEWCFPILMDDFNEKTPGQLLLIFVIATLLFPVLRVIYCFQQLVQFRWRRNTGGRITGITWTRRDLDPSIWGRWFVAASSPIIGAEEDNRNYLLTEEKVLSLPKIKFGENIMDVLSIYKKDLQIYGAKNKDIDNPNISNCNTVDHVSNDESAGTLETSDICIDVMPTEKIVKVAYESCTSCSICICDFEVDEEVRLLPDCGHIFHTECIMPWLTTKKCLCPLCQTPVQRNTCKSSSNKKLRAEVTVDHNVVQQRSTVAPIFLTGQF